MPRESKPKSDMQAEYDFRNGVRGKYADRLRNNLVITAPTPGGPARANFDPKIIPSFEKRRHLKTLSEDDFRDLVVRPLFLRKGMQYGSDTCGTTEAGKDCLFWTVDSLGFRMLYVVQTKAGNITMSRNPSASLQEAITQLRTAMAATVPDISTKKRIKPNVGIFCVSGIINDHARSHIIDEVKEPNLRFIDADDLIPQVDELYPEYWHGIESERFPYLNGLHLRLLNASDVISLATILPEAQTASTVTDEGFAPLRLMRTFLKPKNVSGKVEQVPQIETISVNSLFHRAEAKILIIGEAGEGKSTILRRLAEILIKRAADTGTKLLIPILIRAIDVARTTMGLAEAAMENTSEFSTSGKPAFGVEHLTGGNVALLIDALDEVASEVLSNEILEKIDDFLAKYPTCRVVLTSRQQTFLQNLSQLASYEVFRIVPIGLKEASQIIQNAHRHQSLSKERSQEIVRHLEQVHGMDLNPLLVTVFLASSDSTRKDIPANITEIFAKFTEMMLGRWDTSKGLAQQYESNLKDLLLRKFSYELHFNRKTSFSREEASTFFKNELDQLGKTDAKIDTLIDEILIRSGLIRFLDDRYEFRHLLIQEFFAGRGIPSRDRLLSVLGDEWWRRAIIFYFGQNPQDSDGLLYLAEGFQPQDPTEMFTAAVTLGLATQACYFVKVPEKTDVIKWVIRCLASAHEASIEDANRLQGSHPLRNFIYHYLLGKDSVAADVVNDAGKFEDLWSDSSGSEGDLRKFWTIAGLLENCALDEAQKILKKFNPKDKQLLLAIHLGCFLIEQHRLVPAEDKRAARRMYQNIAPATVTLRRQLLKEVKSELLELRHGKIVSVSDVRSDASVL